MSGLFIRLKNASFTTPGLPVISTTEEERSLAALPGLRFWMDPQVRFEHAGAGQGLRDRLSKYDGDDYSNTGYSLGAAINGEPTVSLTKTPAQGLSWPNPADFAWMQSGYTVAAVLKTPIGANSGSSLFRFDGGGATPRGGVQLRNDQRIEIRSDAASAAYTVNNTLDSNPHLVIASWDAQTGTPKIEVDGVSLVLSAATLPVPVTAGATSCGIGSVSGVTTTNDISYGHVMVFDRAYSRPENAAAKALLVALLADKYGIAI